MGFTDFFKKIKTRVVEGDMGDFSEEEKKQLQAMIRQRKLELVAQSKLRSLEEKYAPKEKKKMSEVFANVKQFRMENLRKRQERMKMLEDKKKKFKNLEERRKSQSISAKLNQSGLYKSKL